jgi:hypothetical protein
MNSEEFIEFVSKCIAVEDIHRLVELRSALKCYLPEDKDKIDTALNLLQEVIDNQTNITKPILKQFEE